MPPETKADARHGRNGLVAPGLRDTTGATAWLPIFSFLALNGEGDPHAPPMQRVPARVSRSRFLHLGRSGDRMRQPDAPIGCPSAIAPPLTLTFFVSSPICGHRDSLRAKASLISIKSRSFGSHPARDRQRLEAARPIPMYLGVDAGGGEGL